MLLAVPELPEVESLRRSLTPLIGRRVVSLDVARWDIVAPTSRQRDPAARAAQSPQRNHHSLLVGARITELRRHGKHLAILADDGRALDVHLGMTGQLLLRAPDAPPATGGHIHLTWTLDDRSALAFRDPRRFGGIWAHPTLDALLQSRWATLGPDALTLTADHLAQSLGATARSIKAALLDQGVAAGIGNIYADESLFRAGIRPTRVARRLTADQIHTLAAAVRSTLAQAIEAGGSTLRDFVRADGAPGAYQTGHAVYGRAGLPCTSCGSVLKSAQIAQRTTVWCSRCQR